MSDDFFREHVFVEELEEVRARRRAAGCADPPLASVPAVDNELVGLAISGGGVRSASFALGAVQALARAGVLRRVDLLSTVSGGGFLGSCLSALLHRPGPDASDEGLPLSHPACAREPAALAHVRAHSDYLVPDGAVDRLRIPALLLRGLVVNLLTVLPLLLLAVLCTWSLYEATPALTEALCTTDSPLTTSELLGAGCEERLWTSALLAVSVSSLLAFAGMAALDPALPRLAGRRLAWAGRNRFGQAMGLVLFAALATLGLIPLLALTHAAILITWDDLLEQILAVAPHVALTATVSGAAVVALAWRSGWLRTAAVYAAGLMGPAVLAATYLGLCVVAIQPPYVHAHLVLDELRSGRVGPGLARVLEGRGVQAALGQRLEPVEDEPWHVVVDDGVLHVHDRPFEHDPRPRDAGDLRCADPEVRLHGASLRGVVDGAAGAALLDALRESDPERIRAALGMPDPPEQVVDLGGSWEILAHHRYTLVEECGTDVAVVVDDEVRTDKIHVIGPGRENTFLIGDVATRARAELRAGQVGPTLREELHRAGIAVPEGAVLDVTRAVAGVRLFPTDDDLVKIDGLDPLRDQAKMATLGAGALVLLVLVWLLYDVNLTGLHRFYRDRLSRAWLVAPDGAGGVRHVDDLRLSQLRLEDSAAPYHIVQAAVNVSNREPALHGRAADFLVFTKRWIGGPLAGWCRTERMQRLDRRLDLGTAMAISGAAAAPQMGSETIRPLAFVLTLLNVRMGYWLPNPRFARHPGLWHRLRFYAGAGPAYLLYEALGVMDLNHSHLFATDGGHIENLGIHELLRRRCRFIVAVDAEQDPERICPSLMKVIRYARMDLGIEIEIDTDSIRPGPDGLSGRCWAVGTIRYEPGQEGVLLYIKSTLTGREPADLRDEPRLEPAFPHASTADQFYTPQRFEAYRALGQWAASTALAEAIAEETPAAPHLSSSDSKLDST